MLCITFDDAPLQNKTKQKKNSRGSANSKPPHIWGKINSRPWPSALNRAKWRKVNKKDNKRLRSNKNRLLDSFVISTVPITAAAFPCWISIPIRWRRNSIARAFLVICFTWLLTSVRNALAPAFHSLKPYWLHNPRDSSGRWGLKLEVVEKHGGKAWGAL